MDTLYQDKVTVITGASQGIGESIARAYADLGAKVIIADIQEGKGMQLVEQLKHGVGQARFVKTDLAIAEDIVDLMFKTYDHYGKIDVLINNAGIQIWESPYELAVKDWDMVLNVNLRAYFLAAREAAKYMKMKEGGTIVNIASTRALMSEANSEAYAASKGGILALTHALSASLATDHIRVNAISPGWIATNGYSSLREIDHKQHFSGRVGKPVDIARACLFLTDPRNSFITGENLIIDGGMTRKMIYED